MAKRRKLVDSAKRIHQAMVKDSLQTDPVSPEHWNAPGIAILFLDREGATECYASPGLEANPMFMKARDSFDLVTQHVGRANLELVKLILNHPEVEKRTPEAPIGWGAGENAVPARKESQFSKTQSALVAYLKEILQPKANAAEKQELDGEFGAQLYHQHLLGSARETNKCLGSHESVTRSLWIV